MLSVRDRPFAGAISMPCRRKPVLLAAPCPRAVRGLHPLGRAMGKFTTSMGQNATHRRGMLRPSSIKPPGRDAWGALVIASGMDMTGGLHAEGSRDDELPWSAGSSKASGKAQRQRIGIKHPLGLLNRAGIRAMLPQLLSPMLTYGSDQRLASLGAKRLQLLVGEALNGSGGRVQSAEPASLATTLRPQGISPRRIPGGYMHAVGDRPHRHLGFWPARKQGLKQAAAHRAMQPADAIHSATAVHRQNGHIKRLVGVVRVPVTEGQRYRVAVDMEARDPCPSTH
jgi:hypothetical protein